MKKKANRENMPNESDKGYKPLFTYSQEKKAKVSLIIAAAVFIATVGTVCGVAIKINSGTAVPQENMELNAAEQYLATAATETSAAKTTDPAPTAKTDKTASDTAAKNLKAKRGSLTGIRVVDISDLKSLSDEDLVDAIVSGNAGVIDRSDIETDQSQNQEVVHQGVEETPPPAPPPEETEKLVNFELGIDISEFNGDIDWNAVRADGITFAFIRCGGRGWGSSRHF